MRWLNELFKPSLKCARLGHRPQTVWRKGYSNTIKSVHLYRPVAERVEQEAEVCRRCGEEISPYEEVSRRPIHSLSLPTSLHDQLDADGELWMEGGVR